MRETPTNKLLPMILTLVAEILIHTSYNLIISTEGALRLRRMITIPTHPYMTQCRILGKFEYTRGPIFKVVLEC